MSFIIGPYAIEQRIASGGMAEVFVATRAGPHGFSKRVALKRILPQFSADPEFVSMFVGEARLAGRLDHPNIVQVFDFGDSNGELYIAMEWVDGTNLNRVLRAVSSRNESVPLDIALYLAAQTARALSHAHELRGPDGRAYNIVHRDVSPANVLITKTGHAKLTDFGIARATFLEGRTDQGRLRGKLGYMSPEQVLGRSLDAKSDVFTLATVLAEMLIAEPLFGTGSDLDILLRIRDNDLRVLSRTTRRVPTEVRGLLERAFARDPRDRPSSLEFAQHIEEIIRRRGIAPSAERVARLIVRLDLVQDDRDLPPSREVEELSWSAQFDPAPPADPDAPLGLAPIHSGERPSPMAPKHELAGLQITSPALYRVQTRDGKNFGPISFPRLVELYTTGKIDETARVSKGEGLFVAAAMFPELTRFITSPALTWKEDDPNSSTWEGQIAPGSLVRVAHTIAHRRETGVLHMRDGDRRKKLYFVDGRPEFIASNIKQELLGEYLVTRGLCLRMEVEMALALLPRYSGRLGDALVGLGALRPVELFRAITAQVGERYFEAFRWRRGRWDYRRGARSHEETFPMAGDPLELLRDAVMAIHLDEIESALADYREQVIVRAVDPVVPLEAYHLNPRWLDIIHSVQGETTIGTMLGREPEYPDDAYRAVFFALNVGLIGTAKESANVVANGGVEVIKETRGDGQAA